MKIYLVGGAVRDKLLGLPIKEKDWVVVGATPADMLGLGFQQVGKDFPVFLHPETHEEYALARTERKIGRGYTGFEFNASPLITLEEDLKRRDITINAMAETESGTLIDPYNGATDLKNQILRHVSTAFSEDPVRILRIARFAARFNFKVAETTLQLMKEIVANGEINALVAERVWKELERALLENYPDNFFKILNDCGALDILFPYLKNQAENFTILLKASSLSTKASVRLAAFFHAVDEKDVNIFCKRYRLPTLYRELIQLVTRYLPYYQQAKTLTTDELLSVLQNTDAFRRESRFHDFLTACEAVSNSSFTDFWLECRKVAHDIELKQLTTHYQGKEIADKVKEKRIAAINEWLKKIRSA